MDPGTAVDTPLLDRDQELAELGAHVAATAAGRGRAVLLTGSAGVGKTSLLQMARRQAESQGLRILTARGTEVQQEMPFGAVRELLSPAAAGPDGESLLVGAAALARGVLLEAEPRLPGPGDLAFTVTHGLFWFTVALADQGPMLLVVDDLQWTDSASLRFLHYLAARTDELPLTLLLAARVGEATLSVGPIAELAADPAVSVIVVRPLEPPATAALMRSVTGDHMPEQLCEAGHEATGGNPFYVIELARELGRRGMRAELDAVRSLVPRRIVESIAVRMEALPGECQAVARGLSVLGDDEPIARVAAVAELDVEEAAAAADGLVAAGLVAPGRPLRFVHPVIQSAVREALPSPDASELHLRAARLIAAEPGGVDRAAAHLLSVDPRGDPWVVDTLREGAQLADARGAPDTGVTLLRRALFEGPSWAGHGQIMLELATMATLTRDPDALELAQKAMGLAETPSDRLMAALNVGGMLALRGRLAAAIETVRDAMNASEGGPALEMAQALILVWAMCALSGREAVQPLLDEATAAVRRDRDPPRTLCAIAALELFHRDGTASEIATLSRRAWADGALLAEVTSQEPFPHLAGWSQALAGNFATAEAWGELVLGDAGRNGSLVGMVATLCWRSFCRVQHGHLAGAEADAAAALQFAERAASPFLTALAVSALALSHLERGHLTEAEKAIELIPDEVRVTDLMTTAEWYVARARIRIARGRPHEALADLESAQVWERGAGGTTGAWPAWRHVAVEAHLKLGDAATAARVAEEAVVLARRFGAPLFLGRALRALGNATGDPCMLDEAISLFDATHIRLEAVRCRIDRALELPRPQRRPALDAALQAADALGAGLEASRARDALVADGGRPRRTTTTGSRALTAAERRVAEAAASELSNREIAERLFLTTKTVENHLTAIYRKLEISSRSQIAARLHG